MSELVERLTKEQEVRIRTRPEDSAEAFAKAWERGYVHVLFPETRGGTELGIEVGGEASDATQADLEGGTGSLHLEGTLVLDYVPVRFIGDLDLTGLEGRGRLERSEAAEAAS